LDEGVGENGAGDVGGGELGIKNPKDIPFELVSMGAIF
jgi:hypothetical protein